MIDFDDELIGEMKPIMSVFFNILPTIGVYMFYHLILVYLYMRDQNILAPVVMHMLVNLSVNLFI